MGIYTNSNILNPEKKDICIFSYNSRDFHDGNQSVCKDLLMIAGNKIPIICNQQNFLLNANKYKIEQCLPDCHIYFKPATKEGHNGRPKMECSSLKSKCDRYFSFFYAHTSSNTKDRRQTMAYSIHGLILCFSHFS